MRAIQVTIELPEGLADELEEVLLEDVRFVSKLVELGLAERHVRQLWQRELLDPEREHQARIVEEDYTRDRGVLAENE